LFSLNLSGTETHIDKDTIKELQDEVKSLLEKVIESNNLGKRTSDFSLKNFKILIRRYVTIGSMDLLAYRAFESSLGAAFN